MIKLKPALAALAAISISSTPVLAQSAQSDNAPVERESASQKEANEGRGGSTGIILAILAAAAIIGGVAVAAGNKDDSPASP
ncbi:MAG: hypothetical protein R3E02_02045 [Blastomonas sp.]